jgi:hypothetical protein
VGDSDLLTCINGLAEAGPLTTIAAELEQIEPVEGSEFLLVEWTAVKSLLSSGSIPEPLLIVRDGPGILTWADAFPDELMAQGWLLRLCGAVQPSLWGFMDQMVGAFSTDPVEELVMRAERGRFHLGCLDIGAAATGARDAVQRSLIGLSIETMFPGQYPWEHFIYPCDTAREIAKHIASQAMVFTGPAGKVRVHHLGNPVSVDLLMVARDAAELPSPLQDDMLTSLMPGGGRQALQQRRELDLRLCIALGITSKRAIARRWIRHGLIETDAADPEESARVIAKRVWKGIT